MARSGLCEEPLHSRSGATIALGAVVVSALLSVPSNTRADEPTPVRTPEGTFPAPAPPPRPKGAVETATPLPPPAHASAEPSDAARLPPPVPPSVGDAPLSPTDSKTPAPEEPSGLWYGWQTLATDGGVLLLMVVVGSTELSNGGGAAPWVVGLTAYALGGPIVHLAHGNPGRGALSLAMRLGMPLLFGYLGVQAEGCRSGSEFCGLGGALIGGSLGIITAITIDAAFVAREDAPDRASALPLLRLALDRRSAGVFAAGRF
jgi:hypothetical protein